MAHRLTCSTCFIRPWPTGSALVRRADAAPGAGLAGDRAGRIDADPRADRQRQDADRVPLVHQPADVRAGARPRAAVPGPLHLAAQGAGGRRRAQPARAARRHRQPRGRPRRRPSRARRRGPHRRHAGGRARPVPARAGRHPDHHAGVALPAPDVERARGAALGRHGHRRRDPRAGADQARRAPGAVAGAARGASRRLAHGAARSASASRRRSVRSTKSRASSAARPRGRAADGAIPAAARMALRRGRDAPSPYDEFRGDRVTRRHRLAVTIVDTSEKKRLDLRIEVPVEDMARLGQTEDIPSGPAAQGPGAHVDLDGDPSAAARAGPRAPLDADLRQQPPHRRAARGGAQRARRRDARPRAPRLARAAAAHRDRRPAEGRAASAGSSRPRRSSSASTWARSISSSRSRRRRRSRAACSASAAPATRSARRAAASSSRSSAATWSRAPPSRARCTRRGSRSNRYPRNPLDVLAQQIVAMVVDGPLGRRRAVRRRPPRRAVRRAQPRHVRRRPRHAVGPLSVRRLRRPPAAPHLGSARERG